MSRALPGSATLISFRAMRNPIRLKNLRVRFLPLYLVGAVLFAVHVPARASLLGALPLLLVGLGLRGWGAGHLVKNDALTTTGPYAYLRHPLYLGTMLIGTGFAFGLGGWPAMGVLLVLWPWFALSYYPRKERVEGERLEARYGERFARYRTSVPALWPRRRAWRDPNEADEGAVWALARYSDNNELGTLLAVVAGWLAFWLRAWAASA